MVKSKVDIEKEIEQDIEKKIEQEIVEIDDRSNFLKMFDRYLWGSIGMLAGLVICLLSWGIYIEVIKKLGVE